MQSAGSPDPPRKPPHPGAVLVVAALLPGMGQVMNGMTTRALTFIFFMFMLGMVSWHLTTPAHSFVGRHAGGFLVYAISVLDAYRTARLRQAWHRARLAPPPDPEAARMPHGAGPAPPTD
jgi:hypothetical protein